MYSAVFIAATGLSSQQRRIDVIADNISNINTAGFKAARLDFKDALYSAGMAPVLPKALDGNLQQGNGTIAAAITKDFTGGSLYRTDADLDVAIEGDGFYEIQDSAGNNYYTRLGTFTFADMDDGKYLMNASGYYVLDNNSERIRVPEDTARVEIDEQGRMKFRDNDNVVLDESQFGLFTFTNITGLESAGASNYLYTPSAGTRIPTVASIIRQGSLEGSNVDLAGEMTRLIRTQRAFSLASRALKTADDMEGIANAMKR